MSEPTEPIPEHIRERLDRRWQQAYQARSEIDLQDLYGLWSDSYDEDHQALGCIHHGLAAQTLFGHLADPGSAVLDAGAGTGIVGEHLAKLGCTNLTALDFSKDILAKAKAKNCYQNYILANLNEPLDGIPSGSYAAVIAVGVFSFGQVEVQALDELARVTQPGGLLVFTQRVDFHESNAMGIRARQEHLEAQGRLERIELTTPAQYLPRKDPSILFQTWVYRVKW
jgi:ubiquinone/menaquinone biosynthesis C-methylase UbiE